MLLKDAAVGWASQEFDKLGIPYSASGDKQVFYIEEGKQRFVGYE